MSANVCEVTLCGNEAPEYRTRGIADEALMSGLQPSRTDDDGWMTCVYSLREWRSSPPDWEEDGIEVPSRRLLQLAEEIAFALRAKQQPEPMRVLPDGDGGVVFERRQGALYEALNVTADCTVSLKRFRSGRLFYSESLPARCLI